MSFLSYFKRNGIFYLFGLILIFQLFFLVFRPISMHTDGLSRHLINAEQLLNFNFSFHTWPLFIFLLAILKYIFGNSLFLSFVYKLPSFISFLGSLYLIYLIFRRFEIRKMFAFIGLIIFSCSSWIILTASAIGQDMLLVFFTLLSFYFLDSYLLSLNRRDLLFLFFASIGLVLVKQTAVLIFFGLTFYALFFKNSTLRNRFLSILSMFLGSLFLLPWLVKNYFDPTLGIRSGLNSSLATSSVPPTVYTSVLDKFDQMFHYLWEFPLLDKAGVTNFVFLFLTGFYTPQLAAEC